MNLRGTGTQAYTSMDRISLCHTARMFQTFRHETQPRVESIDLALRSGFFPSRSSYEVVRGCNPTILTIESVNESHSAKEEIEDCAFYINLLVSKCSARMQK